MGVDDFVAVKALTFNKIQRCSKWTRNENKTNHLRWAMGMKRLSTPNGGRREEMKRALAKFEAHSATLQDNWYLRLKVSANTGQIDEAVSELQDLLASRSHVIPTLNTDPFYDSSAHRSAVRCGAALRTREVKSRVAFNKSPLERSEFCDFTNRVNI
jgi:hypothetical protein